MPIYRKVNKDFFKNWTIEMSYVLGFFVADGNLVETKRGTHFLAFHSKDKDLIEYIKKVMSSDHIVSKRVSDTGCWYRLQIGSVEMFNDLIKLDVRPNKSKRLRLPQIPRKFINDFVRGYFDGDGNVWIGYMHKRSKKAASTIRVSFTSASQDFLINLQEILHLNGLKGGSIGKVKNKECYRLTFSLEDTLKLYGIMYNEPHKLWLRRKKLVFEKFIKMRS